MGKETQNMEYKQSWRDEYLKWICGFANAEGGVLFVGKDDDGQITGITNTDKLLADIPNKVRDLLGIMVDVRLRSEPDGEYIEIVVEPYPYPISYKGQYHYRSGSTKQELRGAALDRFLLQKQGKHWDSVPVPHIRSGELDPSAIDSFRKRAMNSKRLSPDILDEPVPRLLDKLRLFEGDYLKRAAILLFHPDPEKVATGAFVKIGYFKNDADLLYHDEIHGDLFKQVDQTLDLLQTKYLKAAISYQGIQRIETSPVPEPALREALLNTIVHKDYAGSAPIQISVYDDKIMFWNPGILPPGWTVETLTQKHASQPYNPDIANAFFRAGMIEAWGRGIERIFSACKETGAPLPDFKYEESGLWIVLPFTLQKKAGIEDEKTPVKTPVKIIAMMRENPEVTLAEIAQRIGKSVSAVERAASKLVKAGKIKYQGPKKGGQWDILEEENGNRYYNE